MIIRILCEACMEDFNKGTGHVCWCPECSQPHNICNECYKREKKSGNIKDNKISQYQLDHPERYT